jgi:hypothetical protein
MCSNLPKYDGSLLWVLSGICLRGAGHGVSILRVLSKINAVRQKNVTFFPRSHQRVYVYSV